MDGGGISAVKEHLVIWESLRALRDNQLLNMQKIMYGISVRTLFFLVSSHNGNIGNVRNSWQTQKGET